METFNEDKNMLGKMTNWTELYQPVHYNNPQYEFKENKTRIRQLFETVPMETRKAFVELYKYDFEMFDYHPYIF